MQENSKEIIREYIIIQARLGKLDDMQKIIEANLLDSMGLVELAAWLEQRFAIQVTDEDFTEKNFFDLSSLASMVENKKALKKT